MKKLKMLPLAGAFVLAGLPEDGGDVVDNGFSGVVPTSRAVCEAIVGFDVF